MNFLFKIGDRVVFRPDTRHPHGARLLAHRFSIVREFQVAGLLPMRLFIIRDLETGLDYRVYSKDLIRVDRPSDQEKASEVSKRQEARRLQREAKALHIERRKEEFASMAALKIPLTAEGLPDKRYKPRYSAANSPIVIKSGKRSRLI